MSPISNVPDGCAVRSLVAMSAVYPATGVASPAPGPAARAVLDRCMTVRTFDAITTLQPAGDGAFTADVHPDWTIGGKPNGGYLLALLGRAAARSGPHEHVDRRERALPARTGAGPGAHRGP